MSRRHCFSLVVVLVCSVASGAVERFAHTDFNRPDFFPILDRKSTRLNSSHSQISYAVFCLKKKKIHGPLKCRCGSTNGMERTRVDRHTAADDVNSACYELPARGVTPRVLCRRSVDGSLTV